MDKLQYQIRIKESEVNDYILGRISGMLDFYAYDGVKIKSTDVLYVGGEWVFNCEMSHDTYLKVRDYITACYPNRNFEYFEINNHQRVEA